jgi:hypothetical protein
VIDFQLESASQSGRPGDFLPDKIGPKKKKSQLSDNFLQTASEERRRKTAEQNTRTPQNKYIKTLFCADDDSAAANVSHCVPSFYI